MQREQLVSYFFIGLFVFILYQLVLVFAPFFHAIFWAAILSFAFHPLYRALSRLFRSNRTAASIVATVLVLLIVVLPAAFFLVNLMEEAVGFYQHVGSLIQEGKLEKFLEQARQFFAAERIKEHWLGWAPVEEQAKELLLRGAKTVGNFSAVQLAAFTKNLIALLFHVFVTAILLFFFFRNGNEIYDSFFEALPLSQKNRLTISGKVNEIFSAVIRGQLVTSLIQAALTGITFGALGLPLPIFFGSIAFLTSMIPVTGAATVWVPFAVYLFAVQETTKAVTLALVGTFVISLSDNLLKPLLIGKKTKLPVFLLFLGIFGGLRLYGVTGIFLGPVVISLFFVLLEIYRKEYSN